MYIRDHVGICATAITTAAQQNANHIAEREKKHTHTTITITTAASKH